MLGIQQSNDEKKGDGEDVGRGDETSEWHKSPHVHQRRMQISLFAYSLHLLEFPMEK